MDPASIPNLADVSGLQVVFVGPEKTLTAAYKVPEPAHPQPARDKNDADLYVAGGFIAARQSAPILMLDTKLRYAGPPVAAITGRA